MPHIPNHAKGDPPYGSPIALQKPGNPFQPLPPKSEANDCIMLLEDIAPRAAERVAASKKLTFHAVGDTGGVHGTEVQERIACAMQRQIVGEDEQARPHFLYVLGDVAYPVGAPEDYNDLFYEPFKRYDAPIVAIPGNHDGYGRPSAPGSSLDGWRMNFLGMLPTEHHFPYRKPLKLPYVYWELATEVVNIIGLYSNTEGFLDDPVAGTPQQDWLAARLEAAEGRSVILVVHHPPYSLDNNHHGSPSIVAAIDAAAEKAKRWPDAVFSGHVHSYQRFTRRIAGKDIPYVVAGAGGRANKRARLAKLMRWEGHPPITMPFDTLEAGGNKLGVKLVAADWSDPGFLTVSVDGKAKELHCTYWQVPFEEHQPVTWQDRFKVALKTHRITNVQ
jgi:3',5'-cyclic AMP phosphodiesterase CpdA